MNATAGAALAASDRMASLEREMEEMSQEILERYEEVNVLYRLSESFRDMFDERQILERILSESARAARARAGWVAVLRPDGALGSTIHFAADGSASRPGAACGASFPRSSQIEASLARTSIAENRILSLERGSGPDEPHAPLMAAPLPGKAGALGALVLERPSMEDAFRSGDLRLVAAVAAYGASVVENRRLALEMKESERVRGEIDLARRIQQGLLPSTDPDVPGLQVSGLCRPARDVGGDYFGYTHVAPGRFGITIADVSGHGLGAAIGMVMARCLIQSEAHQSDSPSRIASRVNELLHRDLADPGMFVTAFLAVYEEESGRFRYTNAGHNPPLIYRAATRALQTLPEASLGLGIQPGTRYQDRVETLSPGDMLVLYTDGLTEARSPRGEMYGLERLKQLVAECRETAPRQAVEAIVGRLLEWRSQPEFDDDITLVVARKQ